MTDGGVLLIGLGIAGFSGNLVDSILGDTLQRRGWLDNHGVNFFSTLSAALLMGFLGWFTGAASWGSL